MPVRFYIVPNSVDFIEEHGSNGTAGYNERRAKYFKDLALIQPSIRHYGQEGYCIVACDLSTIDHDYVSQNADVITFPVSLDNTPNTANRNAAITALEARNIPAGWITAGMTWRQILRGVLKIILIIKDLNGGVEFLGRLFQNGVTMSTQFQDLPQDVRNKMIAFGNRRNLDVSSLSGASTIRQILRALAEQTPTPRLRGVTV